MSAGVNKLDLDYLIQAAQDTIATFKPSAISFAFTKPNPDSSASVLLSAQGKLFEERLGLKVGPWQSDGLRLTVQLAGEEVLVSIY